MSDGKDNADLRTGEICRLIDLFNIYPSMKGNKYLFKRKFPVIGGIKIWIIICKWQSNILYYIKTTKI